MLIAVNWQTVAQRSGQTFPRRNLLQESSWRLTLARCVPAHACIRTKSKVFLQYVLVLGDHHIPTRASDVPETFKELLLPGRAKHVLCTGNLTTSAQLDDLKKLAPNVHCVRGDYDDVSIDRGSSFTLRPQCFVVQESSAPEETIVTVGGFRIGLIHGHQVTPTGNIQALAQVQRRLDVDVLVSGHTHQQSVLHFEVSHALGAPFVRLPLELRAE